MYPPRDLQLSAAAIEGSPTDADVGVQKHDSLPISLNRFIYGHGPAANLSLSAMTAGLLALFCSYNRPIWIDEFTHFAFGGFDSTAAAASAMLKSIESVNFSQTGVYMLLDYYLLQLFGASAFWLRFPSLIGGALLFGGAIAFCRVRGFNLLWQISLPLLLVCQDRVVSFIGEARPYMPIAGAIMGLVAYYSAPYERRGAGMRLFGWFCLLFGAVIHPYFAPYYAAVVVVTYLDALDFQLRRLSPGSFLLHTEVAMLVVAACLYLAVGLGTWMLRPPQLALDPFTWIPAHSLIDSSLGTHFRFLTYFVLRMWEIILAVGILVGVGFAFGCRRQERLTFGPLLLLFAALALSALVSWMSYRSHYWILQRQWIISVALCCLAIVWLLASIEKCLATRMPRIAPIIGLLVAIYAANFAWLEVRAQVDRLANWSQQQERAAQEPPLSTEMANWLENKGGWPTNDDWVRLANQNIRIGGPVWPVFRKFYLNWIRLFGAS
jgi:hypothetical protein